MYEYSDSDRSRPFYLAEILLPNQPNQSFGAEVEEEKEENGEKDRILA
jgi:hypothetical protein